MLSAFRNGSSIADRRRDHPPATAHEAASFDAQMEREEDAACDALERMGAISDRLYPRGRPPAPGPCACTPTSSCALCSPALAAPAAAAAAAAAAVPPTAAAAAAGAHAAAALPQPPPPPPPLPPPPAAPALTEAQYVARAARIGLYNLRSGLRNGVAKAVRQLNSAGPRPFIDAATIKEKIDPLFPKEPVDGKIPDALLEEAWSLCGPTEQDVDFSVEAVGRAINSKRSDSAPGASGLSARVLKQLWHRCDEEQKSSLCNLMSVLGNGHIPREWKRFLHLIHLLRGVAIPKPKANGIRPIGVAEILINVANTALNRALRPTLVEFCGGNLAIGVRGGQEAMANAVRAATTADPTIVAVNLDVANFFGTASRTILIQELCDGIRDGKASLIPLLRNTLTMCLSGMAIVFEHSDGNGRTVITFYTGFFQGGPLCAPLCAIILKVLQRRYRLRLKTEFGETVAKRIVDFAFADDTNLLVSVDILERVLQIVTSTISEGTKGCNIDKTALFRMRRDDIGHVTLCGVADRMGILTNGISYDLRPSTMWGTVVCGAAIGHIDFQRLVLQQRTDKAKVLLQKVADLVEESAVAEGRRPIERFRQSAITIIRLCVASRLAYFARVHDATVFYRFGKELDTHVFVAVCRILRIRATDLSLVRQEGPEAEALKLRLLRILFALPTKLGGLGFTPLADLADAARLASAAETANRVRQLVSVFACAPVPAGALNDNPLEQPFLPAVVAEALGSATRLNAAAERAASLAKTVPPGPDSGDVDDDPGDTLRSFLSCLDAAKNALSSTHAADDASSIDKLQECLSAGVYEAHRNYLQSNGMPSVWHLSTFREQSCAQASAWLTTIADPRSDNVIPDLILMMAIYIRLFLHTFPNPTPGGPRVRARCEACATHPSDPRIVELDEVHLTVCRSAGHKTEHDAVCRALNKYVGTRLREAAAGNTTTEQFYRSIPGLREIPHDQRGPLRQQQYPGRHGNLPKPAVKGDVTFQLRPDRSSLAYETVVTDVTLASVPADKATVAITSPAAKTFFADTPLAHYATVAEEHKIYSFRTSIRVDPDSRVSFRPFGISRAGRLGPNAKHVMRYLNSALDQHDATGQSPYKARSKMLDLISVALQGGIGAKAIRTLDRHQACLLAAQHQQPPQQQPIQQHPVQPQLQQPAGQAPSGGAPAAAPPLEPTANTAAAAAGGLPGSV